MRKRRELRRAPAPAPAMINVRHACGCEWRWHFLRVPDSAALIGQAGIAAALLCPRCDGTLPLGPGDVSYLPSAVCHAHDGPCPESPHDQLMDSLGTRIKSSSLFL